MKLGKAILSGIILYALIFLVASALLSLSGTSAFGIIVTIFSVALTFVIAKYLYFKGMAVKNPVKEGLLLGLVFVIVMFVIEVPVMVYGFAKAQGWSYFNSWDMILGYLLTLIVPIFAAYKKKRK
jgi:hypothetical protein